MKIQRFESPADNREIRNLWAEVFGEEEAELEKPQIDGTEIFWNRDVVYAAFENGRIMGTVHATFPLEIPWFCGLSGMCTREEVRGKGLGRILFEKVCEELTEYSFLGTSNPVAAKLYHSFGFSFLPGSNVMARFRNGDRCDMDRNLYSEKPSKVEFLKGSPAMRIPMIPLVLYRGPFSVLDVNAGLFSSDFVTQISCMGLYQKYEGLSWYIARNNETKVPGAVMSIKEGRADFFYAGEYKEAAMSLIANYGKDAEFIAAAEDTAKQQILEEMGYHAVKEEILPVRGYSVPCFSYIL